MVRFLLSIVWIDYGEKRNKARKSGAMTCSSRLRSAVSFETLTKKNAVEAKSDLRVVVV